MHQQVQKDGDCSIHHSQYTPFPKEHWDVTTTAAGITDVTLQSSQPFVSFSMASSKPGHQTKLCANESFDKCPHAQSVIQPIIGTGALMELLLASPTANTHLKG